MYLNLETERLLFRPLRLSDAGFILELVNTKAWLEFIGNRSILNTAAANNYIQKSIDSKSSFYHVFELKDTQKAIGLITLLHRDHEAFPDIGFAILPKFANRGYTAEAGKAYLENIIASGKYENVIAITLPTNKRSIRLIEKLGLEYDSDQLKDKVLLSYFSLNKMEKLKDNNT